MLRKSIAFIVTLLILLGVASYINNEIAGGTSTISDIAYISAPILALLVAFFFPKSVPKVKISGQGILNKAVGPDNRARMVLALKIVLVPIFFFGWFFFDNYYPVQGMFMILLFAFAIIGIIMIPRYKPKQQEQSNWEHGTAKWASYDEFINANTNGKKHDGLWIGGGYFRDKSGHLVTFAPPGQGKGTCLIIPNLLIKPTGSYVVTDPKGENACITAKAQKEAWHQNVFIIDPWSEQEKIGAKHGITSSGFNPFDFLKIDMDELPDNCEMIAYYMVPENPQAKEPYWNDRARSMIKMLLLHIVTAKPQDSHTFWTLYKMLRLDNEGLVDLIMEMKKNTAYDGLISSAGNELAGLIKSPETLSGIVSNAQNATRLFESQQLRKSLERSDFNAYDLSKGNCTVYVVIPERFMQSHAAWLRLVIGLCLKAVNAKPNKRVNFLIDEFAVLGRMEDVQRAYAFGRGQNIVMWAFMQSLSQMKDIYGEAGMSQFINNSMVFQAFGLQDQFSKEYVTKMLGDETLIKSSKTEGEKTSKSYSTFGRPLLTAEEVGKEKDIITLTEGVKYLIPRQPYFKNIFEIIGPMNKEQEKTMQEGKLPKDEWHNLFMEFADPAPRVH